MRPVFLLALALLPAVALADGAPDNPRERVWDAPVLEWVERGEDALLCHLRNPSAHGRRVLLEVDGIEEASALDLAPGAVVVGRVPAPASEGLPAVRLRASDGALLDAAPAREAEAFTVGLLVERRTFDAGNGRFGSFVRRTRKSFEDLEALLADVSATTPRARLARPAAIAPFQIRRVDVYDREGDAHPALFDEHPGLDLVVACDEGGPLAGFWLPSYSIGHDFLFEGDGTEGAERRGLWSAWGEQALWHEVLHFRGVPDAYVFHLPAAALPGRATADLPLPDAYRLGLMNSPYQPVRVSALTAAVVNAKRGVARVGACEEPDHEHGHMWRWVPARLEIEVIQGGRPLEDARVRHWRSRPMPGLGDPRRQGVPEDAAPDGEGLVLEGDYLGRGEARARRSLFLLLEVDHAGETRWDVIRLLELNEAWAAGDREILRLRLAWEDLHPRAR